MNIRVTPKTGVTGTSQEPALVPVLVRVTPRPPKMKLSVRAKRTGFDVQEVWDDHDGTAPFDPLAAYKRGCRR